MGLAEDSPDRCFEEYSVANSVGMLDRIPRLIALGNRGTRRLEPGFRVGEHRGMFVR